MGCRPCVSTACERNHAPLAGFSNFSVQAAERGPLPKHERHGGGGEDRAGVSRLPVAPDATRAGNGGGDPEWAAAGGTSNWT